MGASLMAELALRILHQRADFGSIYTYDGKRDALHNHPLYSRPGCPLCGTTRTITELDWALYDPEVSCTALESHP
jgi:hypothetical protein